MILLSCALRPELLDFEPPPNVELVSCGVGPVEAACDTARRLASGRYSLAINAGIAGVFPGRGKVGDAFIVTEELYADIGREDGAPFTLPGGYSVVERVHPSRAALEPLHGLAYPRGVGLTVSLVTTSRATSQRLAARYRADIESMEGFAFLRAAELAGVPALELRGISNFVDDEGARSWDFRAGASATVALVRAVLGALG